METWLNLARGPLFRLCFSLLLLGLLRLLYLAVVGVIEACRRRPDKSVPAMAYGLKTIRSLFEWRTLRRHPIQSVVSILFHTGLLMISLFLAAHVLLWKQAVEFAWPSLPEDATRMAALVVIGTGAALFAIRIADRQYRKGISRQELFWPVLIVMPAVTGYICSNYSLAPRAYQWVMLFHVCCANLVMALIPFTKIAQAVLGPFSRFALHIDLESSPVAGGEDDRHLVWVLHSPAEETLLYQAKEKN